MSKKNSSYVNKGLEAFLILWIIAISTFFYFSRGPLWLDEYNVYQSIEQLSPTELFEGHLVTRQIFPRTYLLSIQQFSQNFGHTLLSLRFLPFVCMLLAFNLWTRIARRELRKEKQYNLFLLSWVAAPLLIYYSAELKQYSMDVFASAMFLTYLFSHQSLIEKKSFKFHVAVLALLPTFILFSYPAYLFLIFPLLVLVKRIGSHPKEKALFMTFVISSLCCLVFSYNFDIRPSAANVHTQGFSSHAISFVSMEEFFKTFGEGTTALFTKWFVVQPKIFKRISVFFSLFGFYAIFHLFFSNIKKGEFNFRSLDTIGLVLFAELIILGILKKYPFTVPRTSLFMCPLILVYIIKGIGMLEKVNKRVYQCVYVSYWIFLIVTSILLTHSMIRGNSPFDPVL